MLQALVFGNQLAIGDTVICRWSQHLSLLIVTFKIKYNGCHIHRQHWLRMETDRIRTDTDSDISYNRISVSFPFPSLRMETDRIRTDTNSLLFPSLALAQSATVGGSGGDQNFQSFRVQPFKFHFFVCHKLLGDAFICSTVLLMKEKKQCVFAKFTAFYT